MTFNFKKELQLFYNNLKKKNLVKSFGFHLFTTGLIVSFLMLFLEVISYNPNFVEIFAFLSASFFIINLFQFNTVNNENKNAVNNFLVQTLFGGVIWVFYAFIMVVLYKLNFSKNKNILITFITIAIISILQIILVLKYDLFNKIKIRVQNEK